MKKRAPGGSTVEKMKITSVLSGGLEEVHVQAVPVDASADAASQTRAIYAAMIDRLEEPDSLQIVAERVFGSLSVKEAFLSVRTEMLRSVGVSADIPVTYLEGFPVEGDALAGVHLTLVRVGSKDVRIEPVREDGVTLGFTVTVDGARRLFLSGVCGDDSTSPLEQARTMFERAHDLVRSAGMNYGSVTCTRIYLRRILDWYDDFNGVRTPLYEKIGLSDPAGPYTIPASTGIQGKISESCECFMDVLGLMKGDGKTCPFETLHNPLQSEATAYGSSFARAVAVDAPDARYVLVSGTASIDESGATVHVDDPVGQVRRTMENFKAVLGAGGAGLDDLYHAVWFCKERSYAEIITREMRSAGWPAFPFVTVQADVCRDDLLVEIDGSGVVAIG